jgi:hypothetical protein
MLVAATTAVNETLDLFSLTFDASSESLQYPCRCGEAYRLEVEELESASRQPTIARKSILTCNGCSQKIAVEFDGREAQELLEERSVVVNDNRAMPK